MIVYKILQPCLMSYADSTTTVTDPNSGKDVNVDPQGGGC